jgi:hypothetical protein
MGSIHRCRPRRAKRPRSAGCECQDEATASRRQSRPFNGFATTGQAEDLPKMLQIQWLKNEVLIYHKNWTVFSWLDAAFQGRQSEISLNDRKYFARDR